jgi:zeta toxin
MIQYLPPVQPGVGSIVLTRLRNRIYTDAVAKIGYKATVSVLEAGGPGSGCRGPNCGRPGKAVGQIPKSEFPLTQKQVWVEGRFRRQLAANPKKAMLQYRAQFGNVLNADNAKELSPDYRRDRTNNAAAVHEGASWLVKKLYEEDLKKVDPTKVNAVFFTAGGAGSGKTTAIEGDDRVKSLLTKAQVVYDGTLRPAVSAAKKIDQALAAGKEAIVMYVHRDPVDSFVNGVLPRAERTGRTVMLGEFAKQHMSIRDSMQELADKYKNEPRFSMGVLDNTHGKGNARASSLETLLPPTHTDLGVLMKELRGHLDEAYKQGKISKAVYRATAGRGAAKEIGM